MIALADAIPMLKKWRDEETVICFESELHSVWGLALRGTVKPVDEEADRVELRSSDGAASVQFSLRRVDFTYGEIRSGEPRY